MLKGKLIALWKNDKGAVTAATTVLMVVLSLAIATSLCTILGTAYTAKAKQAAFQLRCTDPNFSSPDCH